MAKSVVIVVPSQGQHIGWFMAGARALIKEVYTSPRFTVTVVRTKIIEGGGNGRSVSVQFRTLAGHPFSWRPGLNLSRVITISHGTGKDGPNLAFFDLSVGIHQPWPSAGPTTLSVAGKDFWLSVKSAMLPTGKIIFIGCRIGQSPNPEDPDVTSYATKVHEVTGIATYGASQSIAASIPASVVRYVKGIESGRLGVMRRA